MKFIALVNARKPSNVSFAELPASALSLTSKQTALYRSALDRLSKCVGLYKCSKYFSCDPSLRDTKRKISYWPTLEPNFLGTKMPKCAKSVPKLWNVLPRFFLRERLTF